MKRLILAASLITLTLSLGACINIFSIFNGGNVDNIENEDRLIAMGQTYLNNMQYEEAYGAFHQVLVLNPANSVAREGIATAYLFWQVPITNIIQAIISENYSLIGMNNLYNASQVVSTNLWFIINGQGDGAITALDNSVNLNYFVFNSLYATFSLIDSDNDGNILADTNDIYTVYPDFSFSNNLPDMMDFVKIAQLVHSLALKTNQFESLFSQSLFSLSNVQNGLVSSEAIAMIDSIRTPMIDIKVEMDSYLTQFNGFTQFGYTDNYEITNLFMLSQYSNDYDALTNDLASIGITNLNDITNTFPELTNFTSILSNYYGL